jgi:hypothetical protein
MRFDRTLHEREGRRLPGLAALMAGFSALMACTKEEKGIGGRQAEPGEGTVTGDPVICTLRR